MVRYMWEATHRFETPSGPSEGSHILYKQKLQPQCPVGGKKKKKVSFLYIFLYHLTEEADMFFSKI